MSRSRRQRVRRRTGFHRRAARRRGRLEADPVADEERDVELDEDHGDKLDEDHGDELDEDHGDELEVDEEEISTCAPYLARQMSCLRRVTPGVKDTSFLGLSRGAKEAEDLLTRSEFVGGERERNRE